MEQTASTSEDQLAHGWRRRSGQRLSPSVSLTALLVHHSSTVVQVRARYYTEKTLHGVPFKSGNSAQKSVRVLRWQVCVLQFWQHAAYGLCILTYRTCVPVQTCAQTHYSKSRCASAFHLRLPLPKLLPLPRLLRTQAYIRAGMQACASTHVKQGETNSKMRRLDNLDVHSARASSENHRCTPEMSSSAETQIPLAW
jgi:hypothetical protein